ncbi:CNP1-like family protein [Serpentinimonas barnesii]|uniref:CNP1-like family protein n=1 Tax=Serpentinimonas barnesii TaxID=1458427 RepID=UPI0009E5A34D|nr:CNP1-like family protein [Serpentinimonas barnesii]
MSTLHLSAPLAPKRAVSAARQAGSGRLRWMAAWALGASLLAALAPAQAQFLTEGEQWQEGSVPPAPPFSTLGLVPFEVGVDSPLRFGLVPDALQLGADGVIRYVVVAQSASGAVNVLYEGLRCRTQEMRTYARWSPTQLPLPTPFGAEAGQWRSAGETRWQGWRDHAAGRPAWALARAGLCDGAAPNGRPAQMLQALRQNPPLR